MKKSIAIAAVAAAALTIAAAPAGAKSKTKTFKGTTSAGSSITFKAKGNKVSGLSSSVLMVCVSAQSSVPKGGVELYQPDSVTVGQETKSQELEPSAVSGHESTKYYTTTIRKKGKKKMEGTLSLSLSYLIPSLYGSTIYICSGTTEFTAKAK